MLVTNPANRASLQEVAHHPWMTKGYDGAPNNHLPEREPIRFGELDPEVIKGMTGFEFGTPEDIENKMGDILTSDQYLAALANWDEKKGRSPNGMQRSSSADRLSVANKSQDSNKTRSPSKRFSGLGFYGKKITGNIAAAFVNRHEDSMLDGLNGINGKHTGHTIGAGGVRTDLTDPTRGYHPLLSIYYLVKERMERDRMYGPGVFASSTLSLAGPPSTIPSSVLAQSGGMKQSRSAFGNPDTPAAANLMPPAPAATINRESKISQPPSSPRPRAPLQAHATESSSAGPTLPPPSVAEDSFLARRASSSRHRRTPTMPSSAPVSPAPMQGGFRRTAAPDFQPAINEESEPVREAHASAPASHRHSMHIPSSTSYRSPGTNGLTDGPTISSSPSSGGFVKRFGSILGRSHGADNDQKKSSRGRNGAPPVEPASQESPASYLQPESSSPREEPDTPLTQPTPGKTIGRSSTTGASLSPPATKPHQRGASVDTGSPRDTAAQATATGPPIGVDRKRQASMSLASRRPMTTGSLAFDGIVPEGDENEVPVTEDEQTYADQKVSSESKPLYLKVCSPLHLNGLMRRS